MQLLLCWSTLERFCNCDDDSKAACQCVCSFTRAALKACTSGEAAAWTSGALPVLQLCYDQAPVYKRLALR